MKLVLISWSSSVHGKKDTKGKSKMASTITDRCIYPMCSSTQLVSYDKSVISTFESFKPVLTAAIKEQLVYAFEIKYLQQAWSFVYRYLRKANDVGYLFNFDIVVNPTAVYGFGKADELHRYCFCKSMITTTNVTAEKAKVEYVHCEHCYFNQKPKSK